MAKIITQHRRGTTAEWEAAGVIPESGEIIIVIDENGERKLKIGDGVTTFTDLPFITDNISRILNSLNVQLQEAIAGTEDAEPLAGSWEQELKNIRTDINGYVHKSAGAAVRQTQEDLAALEASLQEFINAKNVDGLEYTSNYELYLTSHGVRVSDPVVIVGGKGNGDSTNASTVTFENLTTDEQGNITNSINITAGNDVILTFKFTSVDESELPTGYCTCEIKVDGVRCEFIKNIPNGKEYSVDVTKYISAGSNTVQLVLTDMYNNYRNPRYSVEVVDLSMTTSYNPFVVRTADFDFHYTICGKIKKQVDFYIDDHPYPELQQYTSATVNNAEQIQTIPVSTISSGIHKLKLIAKGVEDPNIVSLPLEVDLMVDNGDQLPMIASTCDKLTVKQGDPITIQYLLYNPSAATNILPVKLQIYTDETRTTLYSEVIDNVTRSSIAKWPTRDYPAGPNVCFVMAYYDAITNEVVASSEQVLNVIETKLDVEPEADPILYLSSRRKGNSQSDRDQWSYTNRSSTVTTKLENFNWESNGWVPDSSNNIALRINGNAKATINYEPFYELNTALSNHGLTFEIDFAVRDLNDRTCTLVSIGDESTKINTQVDEYTYEIIDNAYVIKDSSEEETEAIFLIQDNGKWIYREGVNGVPKDLPDTNDDTVDANGLGGTYVIDTITTIVIEPAAAGEISGKITVTQTSEVTQLLGIKMTPDTATLGTSLRSIMCKYKDEERIRVSFTIDSNTTDSSKLISCYIDGVLSGVVNYTDSDNFNSNSKIILGSSGKCTLDVYCVRLYDKALPASKILDNYIYDHSDTTIQTDVYLDNLIYADSGDISYDLVKEKIPTIIFTGKMPTYKDDKRVVKMDFINPYDPSRNFKEIYGKDDPSFIGIDVEIDVQGTSSQYYVRKNWKVKLEKKAKDAEGNTIKDAEGNTVYEFKNKKYEHMEGEIPANVFCIKVDYAEGTGTHNTQNANFAETLYDDREKLPAQYDDDRVRTTIAGFPCIIFERETDTSPLIFSSKGNFNFDKGAEEAFGFTEDYDVECWEFCNNVHNTTKFLAEINDTDWGENFEARCFYPKYFDYESLGYKSLSKLQGDVMDDIEKLQKIKDSDTSVLTDEQSARLDQLRAGVITRFKRMHDWVVSTKDDIEKFEREFSLHFNLHYSTIYYVYTFFALMTDQRAKNMFLTYWGRRVYINEATGTWMIDDIDTNIYKANPAPKPRLHDNGVEYFDNINGQDIVAGYWYPYLYDNDTSFGIDNSGNPVFDYYHEDIDTWDNGQKYVYNGQESVLWNNFRQKFGTNIQNTYATLRTSEKLTPEKLYEQFIDNGSEQWNASIYNEDAEYKYISMARPGQNGTDPVTGQLNPPNTQNLYQVKGDGKHQFKYFVQNRIRYCDSKWHTGTYPNDIIYLRFNENHPVEITPYSAMYCGLQWGSGGAVQKKRVYANQVAKFRYDGTADLDDLDIPIFGARELSSLGDLSKHNVSRFKAEVTTKLTSIKLGDDSLQNNVLHELDLEYFPLLKSLDITNCAGLTTDIDVSKCSVIEHIYALGSGVSTITTSKGGYIKTLHLPTTISQLYLQSQHDLKMATESDTEGLAIGSKTGIADASSLNITKLAIHDCPNVNTHDIFSKCLASGKLERVYITGVKWEVNDWKELRLYYTPRMSDVSTNPEDDSKAYYVSEHSDGTKTYVKRGRQGNPDVDTGIPAFDDQGNPIYGYGLKGLAESATGALSDQDKINIQGTCVIKQNMSGKDMSELLEHFSSNLIFSTDEDHCITSTVYFRNDENTETLVEKVIEGRDTTAICHDLTPAELALFTKNPSIKYSYVFTADKHGWSLNSDSSLDVNYIPNRRQDNTAALTGILGDRYLYPVFRYEHRTYSVKFFNDDGSLIEETAVPFGSVAVCSKEPLSTVYENSELHPFAGWKIYSNNTPVTDLTVNEESIEYDYLTNTGSVKVYAVYKTIEEQFEIPNELELDIEIDVTDSTLCHIKGRSVDWHDDPNVFVKIESPMTVAGQQRTPVSISGFNNFAELQLIDLPDSITRYKSTGTDTDVSKHIGAFQGCSNLAEITINPTVVDIGTNTFANCSKLGKINFNSTAMNDLSYTGKPFNNVGKLADSVVVNIGENVTKIPSNLFYTNDKTGLKINLLNWGSSSSCKTIGKEAFKYTVVDGTTGELAEAGIFEIPVSVTKIDNYAFQESIPEKNYPVSLVVRGGATLANQSFLSCAGIKKVQFTSPDASFSGNPFADCFNIEEFSVKGSAYKVDTNALLTNTNRIVSGTCKATDISKSATSIGEGAFYGNTSMQQLVVDSSYQLTEISTSAFQQCRSMVSVDLSSSKVTTIGSSAFYKCTNLQNVELPPNLTMLTSHVFFDCPIKEIVIPKSVKTIESRALSYGTDLGRAYLTRVVFEDPSGWNIYSSTGNELLYENVDLSNATLNAEYLTYTSSVLNKDGRADYKWMKR